MAVEVGAGEGGKGILLYSVGVFFFAVTDALGKWLVADYSVGQVIALRSAGAMLVLAPLLMWRRTRFVGARHWRLHLFRVASSAIDTYCFYKASVTMPLADVMTFYLAAPLIVVALSAVALGETVGRHRWAAVLAGFVGVLIALKPSGAALAPASLLALLGSGMFAASIVATRRLRDVPWLELVFYQVVGSGLVGGVVAPVGWVTPSPGDAALMGLVGIVSMSCYMCITKALAVAPASLLAPFQYLSIVWAALMGFLVWGDVPGPAVVAGSVVIVASGLVVLRRERVVVPA